MNELFWLVGLKTWFDTKLIKILCYFRRLLGRRNNRNSPSGGILIIRLDHKIGDMVCFSDFLRQIRLLRPSANITLIIHRTNSGLYSHCPYVDRQLFFDWGSSLPKSLIRRVHRILKFVKLENLYKSWDLAICSRFDEDFHAPFLAFASGALDRIGYATKVTQRKRRLMLGADSLMTRVLPGEGVCHEVERNRRMLLAALGDGNSPDSPSYLETWISELDEDVIEGAFKSIGLCPDDPIIAIGFGAYDAKRVWPLNRYAQLMEAILDLPTWRKAQFVLLGAPSEHSQGEEILRKLNQNVSAFNFAGKTSINECAALLRRSKLFIGNDSGLLHLAAASGCWCVEISCHPANGELAHPNSPARFGPYTEFRKILQPATATPPCSTCCQGPEAHCILEVGVTEVLNAISSIQIPGMA